MPSTSNYNKEKTLEKKMSSAFDWAFEKGYEKVILLGSDLGSLNEKIVLEAETALIENEYVIGPTYDGGYYLIGMKRPSPIFLKKSLEH